MKLSRNATWIVVLAVYFLGSVGAELHLLAVFWPTDGEKFPKEVLAFWEIFDWQLPSKDVQIIALAGVVGALGGSIHGAGTLAHWSAHWSKGQEEVAKWGVWYLSRPLIGAALAVIVYLVVRAGLFSPSSGDAADVNVYGVTAVAGIVGLFSERATRKLKEVAATLFRTREDAQSESPEQSENAGEATRPSD